MRAALASTDGAGLTGGGTGEGVLAGAAPGQVAGGVILEQRNAGVRFDGFAQGAMLLRPARTERTSQSLQ